MSYNYLKQLPVLPPSAYTPADIEFIAPRVLELVYTAWDIRPFADDLWREVGNGAWGVGLRKRIIGRWEECHGIKLSEFLSRSGRVQGGDDPGRDVLSAEQGLPQGGTVRHDQPSSPGGRLGSGEHRGGLGSGESGGIHSVLEDLARFAERVGDTSFIGRVGKTESPTYGGAGAGAVRQAWPDSSRLDPLLAKITPTPDSPLPIPPFKWDEARRAVLRAELDAYYARRYGLSRKQLRYILDPADLTPRELADMLDPREEVSDPLDGDGYARRCAQSGFPGETFRVLKEKELAHYGEYRTRRLVLEAWQQLEQGGG